MCLMADINCVLYLNKFGLSPVVILKIKKIESRDTRRMHQIT